jgi:hypothetical protein
MANLIGRSVRHSQPKRQKRTLPKLLLDLCGSHGRLMLASRLPFGNLDDHAAQPRRHTARAAGAYIDRFTSVDQD